MPASPPAREWELLERLSDRVGRPQLAKWIVDEAFSVRSGAAAESYALEIAQRYLAGEPIQYIFGHWSFRGLELKCDARALIPRSETEQLVDLVRSEITANPWMRKVLEIGTGTGAIALSLASEIAGLTVVATELSKGALALARENLAAQTGLPSGVEMVQSDLFDSMSGFGLFDLIVSNPPYLPASTVLEPRVALYEPHEALFGGADGLALITRLIEESPMHMTRRGAELILEIDETHGARVVELAHQHGYTSVQIHQDLSGRDRFAQLVY
ncbi:MAG: peptide chain release factor N(5)-glutamine methyltransferase [Actinomycetota bacterium]|jgi:release factor glutamine methyltransferase|nr:peptide chain release factor N(5)-glutamine methyltransferase [Actinomycetota bacterium]